jgi:hypothetical protein
VRASRSLRGGWASSHSAVITNPAESPVSTSTSSAESPPHPPEYYWDMGLLAPGDREPPEGLEKYLEVRREQQSREKRGRCDAGSSKLISDDKPDNSPPPKMGKFPRTEVQRECS